MILFSLALMWICDVNVIMLLTLALIKLDLIIFLSQCNAQEIRAAFPGQSEQPWYGTTHFFCFFQHAVFLSFPNPPNSDMDHRICNVRTFLCVRVHWGWGTPTTSQHNILTRKNSQIFLVLRKGFEPLVMESIKSQGRCSTN